MPRPLLPPRGYFLTTSQIFHSGLPSAVFLTWLQLRCLAWGREETPSLPIQELARLTELSRTTLLRHLHLLEQLKFLRCSSPAKGMLCVSFADDPGMPKVASNPPPNFEQDSFPKMDRPNLACSKMVTSGPINPLESDYLNDQTQIFRSERM